MTPAEIAAYNRGVSDILALARRCADVIAVRNRRPRSDGFAIEALDELASAGRALLLRPGPDLGPQAIGPDPTQEHRHP